MTLMHTFLNNEIFLLALTLGVYFGAQCLRKKYNYVLLNPVLVSIVLLICFIKLTDVPYAAYHDSNRIIEFLLKPAVVALGVPLFQQLEKIQKQTITIIISQLAGCFVATASVVLIASWMGTPMPIIYSLAPKSVTTPIAMEVSASIGGIPSLTACIVLMVGVFGAMLGYPVLEYGGVSNPMSQGLSLGTAAHAVGTSRSLEISPRFGAYSSLGLILNGIFTALFAPYIIRLMLYFM